MAAVQQWPVFVSYSRADKRLVTPIVAVIRASGVNAFRDEDSIRPGEKWSMVIAESVADCRTMLVFWSASASRSEAMKQEYSLAINLGKAVVPVVIDETALSPELATYQAVDLRGLVTKSALHARWNRLLRWLERFAGPGADLALSEEALIYGVLRKAVLRRLKESV